MPAHAGLHPMVCLGLWGFSRLLLCSCYQKPIAMWRVSEEVMQRSGQNGLEQERYSLRVDQVLRVLLHTITVEQEMWWVLPLNMQTIGSGGVSVLMVVQISCVRRISLQAPGQPLRVQPLVARKLPLPHTPVSAAMGPAQQTPLRQHRVLQQQRVLRKCMARVITRVAITVPMELWVLILAMRQMVGHGIATEHQTMLHIAVFRVSINLRQILVRPHLLGG